MSDILIRGMEMPKSKPICIVIDVAGQARQYDLNNEKFIDDELYEAFPVPPHGKLGDLDELSKKIEHDRYNHTHTDGLAARHHVAEYGHFLKVISDAPTIIPVTK